MPHFCPLPFLFFPHVGGVISNGAPTVKICSMPAARMGDNCMCLGFLGLGAHSAKIIKGSSSVMICGMPAAYMTSNTVTGGMIIAGIPNVQIGM
ncbi:MAG: PAAR domain-containing protein [Cytophagales bacterium]|nr:PAAR domain-containing protein [Cytophagales bacterium]